MLHPLAPLAILICLVTNITTSAEEKQDEKEVGLVDCGARGVCVEGKIAPSHSTSLMPPGNMQRQWEALAAASCNI